MDRSRPRCKITWDAPAIQQLQMIKLLRTESSNDIIPPTLQGIKVNELTIFNETVSSTPDYPRCSIES